MRFQRLTTFARANWPALVILGVSTLVAVWFAFGFVMRMVYFNDPRHQDEALKAWMTPRYVVMSYDLPRPLVAEVLDLPEGGPGRLTLGDISERTGLPLEVLTQKVRDAAARHRETQQ